MSAELRNAWLCFQSVSERGSQLEPGNTEFIGYSQGARGYHALLGDLLGGGGPGLAEKLALYRHDGGCFADPNFSSTVGPARLLALARERRLREAIGAAFRVQDFASGGKLFTVRGEFLDACGVDKAQLEAGHWLTCLAKWQGGFPAGFGAGRSDHDMVLELLAAGPERDARYVVELARLVQDETKPPVAMDQRKCFTGALGIIIERRPRAGAGAAAVAPQLAPLPDDLRTEAVARLVASIVKPEPLVLVIAHEHQARRNGQLALSRSARFWPLRRSSQHAGVGQAFMGIWCG